MQEEWKKIENFEDYEISNFGRYKSLKNENVHIMKPKKNKSGYLQARLTKNGKHYYLYMHRLVAQAFIQNPNNKFYVNHINGNKEDNNILNLEWCTAKENTHHLINVLGFVCAALRKKQLRERMGA